MLLILVDSMAFFLYANIFLLLALQLMSFLTSAHFLKDVIQIDSAKREIESAGGRTLKYRHGSFEALYKIGTSAFLWKYSFNVACCRYCLRGGGKKETTSLS